jgi:hypothetical protein
MLGLLHGGPHYYELSTVGTSTHAALNSLSSDHF